MLLELVVQILILPVPCTSEINYITELIRVNISVRKMWWNDKAFASLDLSQFYNHHFVLDSK